MISAARSEAPAWRISWLRFWMQLVVVGGLLGTIGAFLLWVRLQVGGVDITHSGIEAVGDGFITMGLGAFVVALVARILVRREPTSRAFGWFAMIAGFFLLSILVFDYQAFRESLLLIVPETVVLVRPEIGLYAIMIGGILVIFGGWLSWRRRR